jgi:hypothetical protein
MYPPAGVEYIRCTTNRTGLLAYHKPAVPNELPQGAVLYKRLLEILCSLALVVG